MGFEKKFQGSKMPLKLANLINKVLLKSGLDFFGIEKCCFVCQSLEDSCWRTRAYNAWMKVNPFSWVNVCWVGKTLLEIQT